MLSKSGCKDHKRPVADFPRSSAYRHRCFSHIPKKRILKKRNKNQTNKMQKNKAILIAVLVVVVVAIGVAVIVIMKHDKSGGSPSPSPAVWRPPPRASPQSQKQAEAIQNAVLAFKIQEQRAKKAGLTGSEPKQGMKASLNVGSGPLMPQEYTFSTAGPKYGASMGTVPQAIQAIQSPVANTLGTFAPPPRTRSCSG
jgi:hypothetical protein